MWCGRLQAVLGIGALLGLLIGRLVIYLRREHKEAVGLDDFLALGLIALSYGVALLAHAYGFLAVFAAGLALRSTERIPPVAKHPKRLRKKSPQAPMKRLPRTPKKPRQRWRKQFSRSMNNWSALVKWVWWCYWAEC
jgi:hypothetical protein